MKLTFTNPWKTDTFFSLIINSMIKWTIIWCYSTVKKETYLPISLQTIPISECLSSKSKSYPSKSPKGSLICISRISFMGILSLATSLSIRKIKLKFVILDFPLKERTRRKSTGPKELLTTLLLNASFHMIKKWTYGLLEYLSSLSQLELSPFKYLHTNSWLKCWLKKN